MHHQQFIESASSTRYTDVSATKYTKMFLITLSRATFGLCVCVCLHL